MSNYDDFSQNNPAPFVDPKINAALRGLARTPSGLPVFCLVWGQEWDGEYAHVWQCFGEIAHRYRHHWDKEAVMAEPVRDLAGQFAGYGQVYRYGDVMPTDGFLVPVLSKKSIGVPRWYVEIGMPVDEKEWQAERYEPFVAPGTSDEVITELLRLGRIRDKWGPPPDGLVEYFPLTLDGLLMRLETHDRRMVAYADTLVAVCCAEKMKAGKSCYGRYRAPTMRDVEMVRRMWQENQQEREFFAAPDETRVLWATESAFKESERDNVRRDAQHADDMGQAMSMLSENRLLGDGSGMDLSKYSTHYKQMPGTEISGPRKEADERTTGA